MSNKVVNNDASKNSKASDLSKEKIRQLLLALGSGETTMQSPDIQAEEYNWNRPHPFSTTQIRKLNDFERRVSYVVAKKFAGVCNADFKVEVTSSTQRFSDDILAQVFASEKDDYFLAFGTGPQEPFGFIKIPIDTAITWITKLLLGDPESEKKQDGDLSQLEESLLFDLAFSIVKAIPIAVPEYEHQSAEKIVRARIPLELKGTEEMSDIKFNFKKTDPANPDNPENMGEVNIYFFCDKLEPVVGKSDQDQGDTTQKDTSEAIVNSFKKMTVCASAQLGSSVLTFEQLMDLRIGDVLQLDTKTNEPIEMKLFGRTVFHGWPAKTGGKYAFVIKDKAMSTQSGLTAQNNP